MILYHGSNIDIQEISLSRCKPNKDFGKGFYLTTIKEQAIRMSLRVSRMFGGTPCINEYSFDENILKSNTLNVKIFEQPSESWARFVIANRNYKYEKNILDDNNLDNRYDIVVGPIANDDLALLFRQFSGGLITVETLVKEMEYKNLTNQFSFHTEHAIACLKKEGVEIV